MHGLETLKRLNGLPLAGGSASVGHGPNEARLHPLVRDSIRSIEEGRPLSDVQDEDADSAPRWIARHSVGCYFCGALADERDCLPADAYNGGDDGNICPRCQQIEQVAERVLQQGE